MSTSGTYTFSTTTTDYVRHAMLNIGKLGEAETPTNQEYTDCLWKLNAMVKQWQGKTDFAPGLKMWTRRVGALMLGAAINQYALGPTPAPNSHWCLLSNLITTTTSAGSSAGGSTITLTAVSETFNGTTQTVANGYQIGVQVTGGDLFWTTVNGAPAGNVVTLASVLPGNVAAGAAVFSYSANAQNPLVIDYMNLRDNTGSDVPMRFMTVQDYALQPSKGQPQFLSDPYFGYFEYQLGSSNLFFEIYGSQDTSKYVVIGYREPIQTFVNTADNPEFPDEWVRPITLGLSKEIAPMFNMPWTQELETMLQESLAFARQKDAETTTLYFQPGVE